MGDERNKDCGGREGPNEGRLGNSDLALWLTPAIMFYCAGAARAESSRRGGEDELLVMQY